MALIITNEISVMHPRKIRYVISGCHLYLSNQELQHGKCEILSSVASSRHTFVAN